MLAEPDNPDTPYQSLHNSKDASHDLREQFYRFVRREWMDRIGELNDLIVVAVLIVMNLELAVVWSLIE